MNLGSFLEVDYVQCAQKGCGKPATLDVVLPGNRAAMWPFCSPRHYPDGAFEVVRFEPYLYREGMAPSGIHS